MSIIETHYGHSGPIYDIDLPDRSGECGCLARIFSLPAALCAGRFHAVCWKAEGKDIVRHSWQVANNMDICSSVTYRLLSRNVTGEELCERINWAQQGKRGLRRLLRHTHPVLGPFVRLASRAEIPLFEDAERGDAAAR